MLQSLDIWDISCLSLLTPPRFYCWTHPPSLSLRAHCTVSNICMANMSGPCDASWCLWPQIWSILNPLDARRLRQVLLCLPQTANDHDEVNCRIRVLDLNQGQGWYITYDPKPKISLALESEILPCELDVPFQGTPRVHLGIPHMNFGGPLFPKILRNNELLIAKYYFSMIF